MKSYSLIFWLVIIALGTTLYLMGDINSGDKAEPISTPTPVLEAANTPTPTYVPTSTSRAASDEDEGEPFSGIPRQGLVGTTPPRSSITGPATCQLSGGTITFLDEKAATHDNAYIAYQNVDHPARLLFWEVNHDGDVLNIGPNIFDGLGLPDGQENITVTIEGEPQFTSYVLTVRINYGIVDKDGGVIGTEETNCTGNIIVNLDYLK